MLQGVYKYLFLSSVSSRGTLRGQHCILGIGFC